MDRERLPQKSAENTKDVNHEYTRMPDRILQEPTERTERRKRKEKASYRRQRRKRRGEQRESNHRDTETRSFREKNNEWTERGCRKRAQRILKMLTTNIHECRIGFYRSQQRERRGGRGRKRHLTEGNEGNEGGNRGRATTETRRHGVSGKRTMNGQREVAAKERREY